MLLTLASPTNADIATKLKITIQKSKAAVVPTHVPDTSMGLSLCDKAYKQCDIERQDNVRLFRAEKAMNEELQKRITTADDKLVAQANQIPRYVWAAGGGAFVVVLLALFGHIK